MSLKDYLSVSGVIELVESVLHGVWDKMPGHLPTLLHAYVLVHLWAWFVTPTFHVATLAYVPAVGLMLVTRLVFKHCVEKYELDHELGYSLGFLVAGFLTHLFM
jgi:hypothetical protein